MRRIMVGATLDEQTAGELSEVIVSIGPGHSLVDPGIGSYQRALLRVDTVKPRVAQIVFDRLVAQQKVNRNEVPTEQDHLAAQMVLSSRAFYPWFLRFAKTPGKEDAAIAFLGELLQMAYPSMETRNLMARLVETKLGNATPETYEPLMATVPPAEQNGDQKFSL